MWHLTSSVSIYLLVKAMHKDLYMFLKDLITCIPQHLNFCYDIPCLIVIRALINCDIWQVLLWYICLSKRCTRTFICSSKNLFHAYPKTLFKKLKWQSLCTTSLELNCRQHQGSSECAKLQNLIFKKLYVQEVCYQLFGPMKWDVLALLNIR